MSSTWLTSLFSSIWRLLLRLEHFLERTLLWLASSATSIPPIWLAALFLPCAGSIGVVALMIRPRSLFDWSDCAELGALAGAGPTVIVLICVSFVPRRFASWTVAIGSGMARPLAA